MSAIFFVGRHVGHLVHLIVSRHVHLHVGHHDVVSTLTEWKSESITDDGQITDRLTGVGARDTCVSKKKK